MLIIDNISFVLHVLIDVTINAMNDTGNPT